jgi:Raf kinase inhibitor-like YbhB/YbcL family protein
MIVLRSAAEGITMRVLIGIMLGLFLTAAVHASDFELKSPAFSDNKRIPSLYTCNGKNRSPELAWKNAPSKTQSFVLIVSCPDSAISAMYYLWVVYNIPAQILKLAAGTENLPEGVLMGTNSLGDTNYAGPCPPDDHVHHYVFTLYALDIPVVNLEEGPNAEDVLAKIRSHILSQTEMTGLFSH